MITRMLKIQSLVDRHAAPAVGSALLLLTRVVWGYAFFVAGKGKLGRLPEVADFFASLHIPAPYANALFVSTLECVGGLLLLTGLLSRPVAFLLAGNMVVAYLTTEKEVFAPLFTEGDPALFAAAAPFWFLAASVLILALGPGKLSLDALARILLPRLANRTHPVLRTTPAGDLPASAAA